jgi:glucose/arabinose dehydrogenase
MRTLRRQAFILLTLLLAIGGSFSALGAAAQEATPAPQQGETVRPGGDLPGDPSVELVQIADGLIDPINITSAPDGSGRLFVVERVGFIRIIQDGQLVDEPFLDLSDTVKTDFLEQGLLGLAFHPDFANNGRFFVYYSDYLTNGNLFLVEYTVSGDDPNVADPDSGNVLLTVDDPFVNHNGGDMAFGPDGYLYLAIGDGGMAGDPYDNAQNKNVLLGKILRLDVDSTTAGNYGIPEDNPFAPGGVQQSDVANEAAQTGDYRPAARPEIWMYGLRNPWSFAFDPQTGDMYIADVGQVVWEEINYIEAGQGAGWDFGWDPMEASHCYPPDESESCAKVGVMPVAEYQHGDNGCSITGVGVYRGTTSPELDGIYFASDFCSGKVWGLERDDAGAWQFQELFDSELAVTGAGQGEDGELYITACNCAFGRDYDPYANPGGSVWQIVSSEAAGGMGSPVASPQS